MRNFLVAITFAIVGSTLTRLFIQTGNWWFAVIFAAIVAISSWKVYDLTRQMNAHRQTQKRTSERKRGKSV